ncbi:MAG: HopJ type III effector protein [Flavobacteriaceae bacterium]|nr:HopJ type III effector protein [Flavobacteriaceae bacterium]
MTITAFAQKIKMAPSEITFQNTMDVIEAYYTFSPTSFVNGNIKNEAGQNSGSCKIFSFAKLQKLNKEETLNCFGDYYRSHVLGNPKGEDHQNIRSFMKKGWEGISFSNEVLCLKT